MKRLWLGVGILMALMAAGFWAADYADRIHGEISDVLEDASRAALEEDWQQAVALGKQAREKWEKNRGVPAALSDHTVLDEIDAGFARLEVYGRDRHPTDFAAQSGALARQVEALGEGHRLSLSNLL